MLQHYARLELIRAARSECVGTPPQEYEGVIRQVIAG